MGYEVDFLGTESETKSGDAIAIRFGNLVGSREEQSVVVIDGGFTADGPRLVEHIRKRFRTEVVDLVISTHPDQDHINGLETVFNELTVRELWIHKAWEHNQGLADKFEDGRITDNSMSERLRVALNKAHELCKTAERNGVLVREPFSGLERFNGSLKVLGPTRNFYEALIPEFEGLPASKSESSDQSFMERALKRVVSFFVHWGEDKIDDSGVTSARNNSSVITQLIIDGRRILLTGDAGIKALEEAAENLDVTAAQTPLRLIQIPHHGSRRNVGPSILNRLIGEPVARDQESTISAIASTARNSDKHPRKTVMNAFNHRGAKTMATRGTGLCHKHDAPQREGWGPIEPEPYHYHIEETQ